MESVLKKSLAFIACTAMIQLLSIEGIAGEGKSESKGEVKVKKDRYIIKVNIPSGVVPGKEAKLKVTLLSVSPWVLNIKEIKGKKFPFKIKVSGDSQVAFKKNHYTRDDASKMSPEKIVFHVPFTTKAAGQFSVGLKVDLCVCKEGSCVPFYDVPVEAKIKSRIPDEQVLVEKEKYTIKVTFPAEVASGKASRLKVTILPVSPFKMNEKFPFRISVAACKDVSFDKKEYKKADASSITGEKVVFSIPFTTGKSGELEVDLNVHLSVVSPKKKSVEKKEKVKIKINSTAS